MIRFACISFGIAMAVAVARGADQPVPVAVLCAMDSDGGNVRELASHPEYANINSPEISPDGRWVAVDGWRADENLGDARVLLVKVDGDEPPPGTWRDLGPGAMPTFSPGGHRLVISRYGNGHERGIWVLNMNGADPVWADPQGWSGRWSPDGHKLAWTARRDGGATIEIMDIIEGLRHTVLEGDHQTRYSSIYHNFCWSPDSKAICFKGRLRNGGEEVAIVDARGSSHGFKSRLTGAAASQFLPDIAWHPDGSLIAMPTGTAPNAPGQILVFDPAGTEPPARLEGQPAGRANGGMCWSPDGKTLYFLSRE
jgi:TolB protein